MRLLQGCFATVLALIAVFIGTAVLAGVVSGPQEESARKEAPAKHEQAEKAPEKVVPKPEKKQKAEPTPEVKAKVKPEPVEEATASVSASASASAPSSGDTVLVTDVVDGDTFDINESIQGMDRVRLIGVDTPEVYGGEEPCGPEASEFTTQELEGQQVELEIGEDPEDPYGRLLAYVYVGDEFFNETLVFEGLATAESYPPNTKYDALLEAAEASAKAPSCGADTASASASASAPASAAPDPSSGGTDKLNNGIDDVNCSDLSGPVAVSSNEDGLDADGDGIGCDS